MKKTGLISETELKILAMVSMVLDHVGDLFFPGVLWLRMAGRIAMPVFSFCIAEGYAHTRDRKRYLLRMGLFALISEIPFDLAFEGRIGFGHQNIMLTFFLSILALELFDRIRGGKDPRRERFSIGRTLLHADYTCFAVVAVFLFYVFRDAHPAVRCGTGVAFLALTRTMSYYCATGFSFIPLILYNGKRGRGLKWLFYAFYPGHLLVLYLLQVLLQT